MSDSLSDTAMLFVTTQESLDYSELIWSTQTVVFLSKTTPLITTNWLYNSFEPKSH